MILKAIEMKSPPDAKPKAPFPFIALLCPQVQQAPGNTSGNTVLDHDIMASSSVLHQINGYSSVSGGGNFEAVSTVQRCPSELNG